MKWGEEMLERSALFSQALQRRGLGGRLIQERHTETIKLHFCQRRQAGILSTDDFHNRTLVRWYDMQNTLSCFFHILPWSGENVANDPERERRRSER